ncbi:MAG: acyl-CoA thioesterase [Chloroflexi bacterium AL-W]|nr:acyl-CoA thioesterase [Chloroflexi bacterium AL-N1]NOK67856.1 acyl-CoA thioesterase [Chloroflexi bacterium AL-N10]NOK75375.1 acyl-CoA thioesterase [Chloroflexi bacterium AL-N5]NOK82163.1 acyl-CoA thioesterase [Chloroflexi bacterium AL-W]NOK90008.1 acyl-CoA thioesterase [Chloroflexi bacterium AL-N15]
MNTSSEPQNARVAPEVHMADIVLPNQTNNHGTMFGGDVMAFMDRAAAIAALRFCRQPVVTASTERLDFRTPIQNGEIIEAVSKVIYVGRTSLIVRIHIYAEHPLIGDRRLCTTGYFSMVAFDQKNGQPCPVPRLVLEDDAARAEWALGEEVRQSINARRMS